MAELNRAYPEGMLRVTGNYSEVSRDEGGVSARAARQQEALENRVRTRRSGCGAGRRPERQSQSAHRQANELIGELADLDAPPQDRTADIDFSATDRKTKRLIEVEGVSYSLGDATLFDESEFYLTLECAWGLLAPTAAAKPRCCGSDAARSSRRRQIKRADSLRVMYFDQNRAARRSLTLRRALAPDSDSVIYQDRVIHVASWAARFLFTGEQLNQPVSRLPAASARAC